MTISVSLHPSRCFYAAAELNVGSPHRPSSHRRPHTMSSRPVRSGPVLRSQSARLRSVGLRLPTGLGGPHGRPDANVTLDTGSRGTLPYNFRSYTMGLSRPSHWTKHQVFSASEHALTLRPSAPAVVLIFAGRCSDDNRRVPCYIPLAAWLCGCPLPAHWSSLRFICALHSCRSSCVSSSRPLLIVSLVSLATRPLGLPLLPSSTHAVHSHAWVGAIIGGLL
ncbi:hypothetical protein C8Q80DRAFT_345082 [Daedaleopsis nitida]|nr:hypothetical protein C8Q80DRAFT_345082 [Daedaleopsis nitida]